MHAMDPRVIIAVLLVLVLTGSTVADEECYEHTEVIECNGSCFEVVKPMLAHFRELKSGADKKKEIQENKEEIKRKDDIQNKRDAEIQEKTEQAKSKDFQNKNLTSQINVLSQNLTITIEKLGKCVDPNPCNNVSKDIYQIRLPGVSAFEAPCNGSGWMVIQRRMDGRVNFNRNWVEYRDGFGNLAGEFFLGLEKLHLITQSRQHELLIHLGKLDGSTAFEKYDNFRIGSEKDSYPLQSVGNPTGGAGDTLTKYHLNMKFSTIDRDNDVAYRNCASYMGGGLITVDTAPFLIGPS
ncbi:uncharacterized protein Dana_GF27955 [Drosophila ananassae]|uniref:Fibrinogen C-terminal domain-containing protein n=1 Tax=Drosophila ananassae TaxID=7217 RepID=A0A0P9A7E3_DROAN|nr:uncharacterized protein Dana_GF27955 [Drosophila ananassae]